MIVSVSVFLPLAFLDLPLADRIPEAAALCDLIAVFCDFAGLRDLATDLGDLAPFTAFFLAGVVRFLATGAFLVAVFFAAAFFKGFLGDDFLVERAIKKLVGAAFRSRPD
ncbi:MAG: hypothetical protein ACREIF_13650 [Chthoniobacterales bacterium]